jgi:hypothetical protein
MAAQAMHGFHTHQCCLVMSAGVHDAALKEKRQLLRQLLLKETLR